MKKTEPIVNRAACGKEAFGKFLRGSAPGTLLFTAGPVLCYIIVEYLNGNNPVTDLSAMQGFLNLAWYYIIFFVLYLAIGRLKLAAASGAALFLIIGAANHYVYSFRGRTIFPGDLIALQTALNVAGGYNYAPDTELIVSALATLLYIGVLAALPHRKGRRLPCLPVAVTAGLLSVSYVFVFFFTGFLGWAKISPSMWSTRGNGFILNFGVALSLSAGEVPEGYDKQYVMNIINHYGGAVAPADAEDPPENIIVVMNESFSDLSVLGDFPTNIDYMPYYDSLRTNCIKGYAYSSVFGGTTANSEYEFLTGNSMAFFPDGTVPYHMYVRGETPSLVSQMKKLGYTPIAMHPYMSSGWNRVPVYKSLGFEKTLFKNDFKDTSLMRNYITDQSNYENVIRVFEEKDEGESLFIFNVTMQNHSAYNVEYRGLPVTAELEGAMQGHFPGVDQFLSLMKQSDLALEYLLDYFSNVDESTLILIFGDHQPQVESSFFELMLGNKISKLPLPSLQTRQMVPYCFWANYDLEEYDGEDMSLNYLACELLDVAGLQKTRYQSFLSGLSEKLPVINALGLRTDTGEDYLLDSEHIPEPYKTHLKEYEFLQYNNVFGDEDTVTEFFTLDDGQD